MATDFELWETTRRGNCGRTMRRGLGSQLRHCFVCGKGKLVREFNFVFEQPSSSGEFGDDEDLYFCDGCAGAAMKTIHALRADHVRRDTSIDELDLLADDAS